MCGKFLRREITHQPPGFHFLPLAIKKQNGRRADDAELAHQLLIDIVVGGNVGLQRL
ncbi:hypothetical protein D3C83_211390 [compost metagenome]